MSGAGKGILYGCRTKVFQRLVFNLQCVPGQHWSCFPDMFVVLFVVCLVLFRLTGASSLWPRIRERLQWKSGRSYAPSQKRQLLILLDNLQQAEVRVSWFVISQVFLEAFVMDLFSMESFTTLSKD